MANLDIGIDLGTANILVHVSSKAVFQKQLTFDLL